MKEKQHCLSEGQRAHEEWRDTFLADPEYRRLYEEEAAKSELWLQVVEVRQAAGLTQAELARRMGVSQAQVARIEKRGYDAYTLNTLRRFIKAVGDEFELDVSVRRGPRRTMLRDEALDTRPEQSNRLTLQPSSGDK